MLALTRAFPEAPLYTSLYDPRGTFEEFEAVEVRTSRLQAVPKLRHHHRMALPFLAPSFSNLRVTADVVVCSSSGWAHGAHVDGRKIVYCHTPARWLYQSDRYLRGRGLLQQVSLAVLRAPLTRWDKSAAASVDRYLANSTVVAERIENLYGVQSKVIFPPPGVTPEGRIKPIDHLSSGFILCVSRLLPYKNVDAVIRAFAGLPNELLVVAGDGPLETKLRALATPNVMFLHHISDEELRWLYTSCDALVAASHEDFGLTPIEAAGFGRPTVALRWGGFLDTVNEEINGIFFEKPTSESITSALRHLRESPWDEQAIRLYAAGFSEKRFVELMRAEIGVT